MFDSSTKFAFPHTYPQLQSRTLPAAETKNCRSLFIKNLSYELEYNEFLQIFERFGAIASCFSQIKDRGMAFILYYDLRSAKAAVKNLQNLIIKGRRAIVEFASRTPSEARLDLFLMNPSIVFTPINYPQSSDKQSLITSLEMFGEISSINEKPSLSITVTFYDSRSARSLLQSGPTTIINGVNFSIKCENSLLNNCNQNVSVSSDIYQLNNPFFSNVPFLNYGYNNVYANVPQYAYQSQAQANLTNSAQQMKQDEKSALEAALKEIAKLT